MADHNVTIGYGDYQIRHIDMDDLSLNGVHYTQQGAWLGKVNSEEIDAEKSYEWVKPVWINGERILAPTNWKEKIERFLSSLDI